MHLNRGLLPGSVTTCALILTHVPLLLLPSPFRFSPLPLTSFSLFRVLDAELEALLLSKAAQFRLPAEWVTRLASLDPERRQVQLSSSMARDN